MRFDDRLSTILSASSGENCSPAVAWTQIVDLLAQSKESQNPELRARAFESLEHWRYSVPDRRRLATAVAIAGRCSALDLILFFANDVPQVSAPILLRAQLDADDWKKIIKQCSPASRALLRERRDLPAAVVSALNAFGSSDFALPASELDLTQYREKHVSAHAPAQTIGATDHSVPISELVKRIDAYRSRRSETDLSPRVTYQLSQFAFESDADGLIRWVDGAPRGPLVGISLAEMASPGEFGVDGRSSGAFRKRDAIRDARLIVAGEGLASGKWSISAQPFFDAESGRFGGYRGIARRKSQERADSEHSVLGEMSPTSIRQFVHELRTPLNAIRGFSEMIEGQFLGPVEPSYRDHAKNIVNASVRLLRIFEDLDVAARLSDDETPVTGLENDAVAALRSAAERLAELARSRSARLQVALPKGSIIVVSDQASLHRMLDRILLCALATAATGETVRASVQSTPNFGRIQISRPIGTRMHSEQELLDPTLDSPALHNLVDIPLGFAFLIRLVRKMARQVGGRFEIGPDSFTLILSRAGCSEEANLESS